MYYDKKQRDAEFVGLTGFDGLGEDSYQLISPEAPVEVPSGGPGGQMVSPDPGYGRPSGGQVISYVPPTSGVVGPTRPQPTPGYGQIPQVKPGFVWIKPPKNTHVSKPTSTKPKIQLIPEPEDESGYDPPKVIPTQRIPNVVDAPKVTPTNRMPNVIDAPMSIAERQKEFGELLPAPGSKIIPNEPSLIGKPDVGISATKTVAESLAAQSTASAEKLSGTLSWISDKLSGKETSLIDVASITKLAMAGVQNVLTGIKVPAGQEESSLAVWESISKLQDFGKNAQSFSKIAESFGSGKSSNSDMSKVGAYLETKFRPAMEEAGIRLINDDAGRMGNLLNSLIKTTQDAIQEFGTKSGTNENEIKARVDALIVKNAPAFRPDTGDADFYVKLNFGKGKEEAAIRQKEIQAQKRSWGPEHDVD